MEHQQVDYLARTLIAIVVFIQIATAIGVWLLYRTMLTAQKQISGFLGSHSTWLDIAGKLIAMIPVTIEGGSRLFVGVSEMLGTIGRLGGLERILGRDVKKHNDRLDEKRSAELDKLLSEAKALIPAVKRNQRPQYTEDKD